MGASSGLSAFSRRHLFVVCFRGLASEVGRASLQQASEQGAAPDRLQLRSSCLLSALSAAVELVVVWLREAWPRVILKDIRFQKELVMLVRKKITRVIAAFCASMLLIGCSNADVETAEAAENVPPVNAGKDVPAPSPTPKPKPRWGQMFSQAVSLIGKPKADLVTQLGPPTSTSPMLGRYRYEIKSTQTVSAVLDVFMAKDNNVQWVDLNLSSSPRKIVDAGMVWEALETAANKPQKFLTSKFDMNQYWFQKNQGQTPTEWSSEIAFFGQMKGGQTIQLMGRIKQPLLKGDRVFDIEKDGYVIKNYHPNNSATWRSADIFLVTTNRKSLSHPDWKQVTEYSVSE